MYKALVNETSLDISLDGDEVIMNENIFEWDMVKISEQSYHIIHNNKSYRAELISVNRDEKTVDLKINGKKFSVSVKDKMDLLLERLGMDKLVSAEIKDIKAPMPGLVLDVLVNEGDEVKKGDQVMVLEAMKMENVLKSPGDGTVKSIKVKKGDGVEKNQVMILF